MRLSGTLSVLSIGLFASQIAARALPAALAEAEPQSCDKPCGSGLCCSSSQYCQYDGQCSPLAQADSGASSWKYFTTTYVTTDANVQTITSTWSQPMAATITKAASASDVPTYTWQAPVVSSTIRYPTISGTLGASVTGSNTFLVPIPTASETTGFGLGGIVGADSEPQGLTSAQIGGIVGGILGAFFLIALILLCCCMRRGFGGRREEHTVVHESGHHHGHAGSAAAAGGLMGYLFGRRRAATTTHTTHSSHMHSSHGSHGGHGTSAAKAGGMAALLGGAAAGLTSMFASRRNAGRTSEKYSTTDYSSGYYTSDITDSTSYVSTTETSTSSSDSSSSSSSSSGHPHGHR